MHQLVYELKRLAETHREGSYATQANRKHMLMLFGEQLVAAGFRHATAAALQGRHVTTLLAVWPEQELASATLKNRLSIEAEINMAHIRRERARTVQPLQVGGRARAPAVADTPARRARQSC